MIGRSAQGAFPKGSGSADRPIGRSVLVLLVLIVFASRGLLLDLLVAGHGLFFGALLGVVARRLLLHAGIAGQLLGVSRAALLLVVLETLVVHRYVPSQVPG